MRSAILATTLALTLATGYFQAAPRRRSAALRGEAT